jgi:hypothetical protein
MPYVTRDQTGRVIAISEAGAPGAENLTTSHPDLLDFLFRGEGDEAARRMLLSDLALLRGLEDLIEVLVSKRVLSWTDLPLPVQDKLLTRRALRAEMQNLAGAMGEDAKII